MANKVNQLEESLTRDSDDKKIIWGDMADVGNSRIKVNSVDLLHQKVEDGGFFTASKIFVGVADEASVYMAFTTGATATDVFISAGAGGLAHLKIYEDPNISGGASLVPVNHLRSGGAADDPTIVTAPTIESAGEGDLLYETVLPGGRKGSGGAAGNAIQEWVMDPATEYLIEVVNESGGVVDVSITLSFYTR